ncbi:hypothetical protein [Brevundimonas sp. FT23042]|uniref:hypothetical protein n=1 Tax=Brevundimonas sp. FT23042 TaxID=3393749 RepID=UPI003B5879B5
MTSCILNCFSPADSSGGGLATLLSAAGLLLTAISASIAALAYIGSRKAAADAHMHSLFREYLRLRIERASQRSPWMGKPTALDREVRSSKHYVLEEMYGWLAAQWPPFWRSWLLSRRRMETLAAWKNTIAYHLRKDGIATDLALSADCYSARFLQFAGRVAKAEQVPVARPACDLEGELQSRSWKWEPINRWPSANISQADHSS